MPSEPTSVAAHKDDGQPRGERVEQGPAWVYDPKTGKLAPEKGWPIKR